MARAVWKKIASPVSISLPVEDFSRVQQRECLSVSLPNFRSQHG